MNVGTILKRIAFEITFFLALVILLPFHFCHALILLTIEVCKHYPREIYAGVAGFYYGDDEKDS